MKVELPEAVKRLLKEPDGIKLLNPDQKQNLVTAIEDYNNYRSLNKIYYYNLDPVFEDFFRKGATERVRGLIAANRCGKTWSSTFELACHLTGIYPTKATHGWDWPGLKYPHCIDAWALGATSESTHSPGNLRDLLFGPVNKLGTGWIPKAQIESVTYVNESKGIIKHAQIKHKSGQLSSLGFRVYSQGSSVLMGANIDLFLIDECPRDDTIFPQLMTRIQKAKKGLGRAIVAATPEYGLQEIVAGFYNENGQYKTGYCPVTVWDVSHISPADIKQMKKDYPKYQWDMRLKGLPIMGSGSIYPTLREHCEYQDVKIEDHWKVVQAVDFGWTHPAAVVSVAWDPDTDIVYVFRAMKKSEWDLPFMAEYINAIGTHQPVVFPHDGANGTQAGGGIGLRDQLAALGCNMTYERFHNPTNNDTKNNHVEPGLSKIRTLLKVGRLKIHSTLAEVWSEYTTYHYDSKTMKPHKQKDDLMDAMRYAILSVQQYGVSKAESNYAEDLDVQNYIEDYE